MINYGTPEYWKERRSLYREPLEEEQEREQRRLKKAFERSGHYETGGYISARGKLGERYGTTISKGLRGIGLQETEFAHRESGEIKQREYAAELQKYLQKAGFSQQELMYGKRLKGQKELLRRRYELEEEYEMPFWQQLLYGTATQFAGRMGGAVTEGLMRKAKGGQVEGG